MDRSEPTTPVTDADLGLARAWRDHQRLALDIAFRMLGDLGDAEDVVQEAFARLARDGLDGIDDVRGWLVVVVGRLCIDRLRWRRRHPTELDPNAADDAADVPDPSDRITLDDSIRIALQQVLDRLTPPERASFVLHDVFRYPFDAVAEILGRTPAACRQLASRARRTVQSQAGPQRHNSTDAEQRLVTERFIHACSTGDLESLLALLDPDVSGAVEGGGGRTGRFTLTGRDEVARRAMRFLGPDSSTTLLSTPGDDGGVMAVRDGCVVAVLTVEVRGGLIIDVDGIADPARLASLNDAIASPRSR
jgi:RNA polymerase sigma-70 factor (ECF subfamily)